MIYTYRPSSRHSAILRAAILLGTASLSPVAFAQSTQDDRVTKALAAIGAETIRDVHTDICLPADADEYAALGKNAILMLQSSTAIATELPLRSVYAMHKGVRIPLQRLATKEKTSNPATQKTTQVSFYLLPIQLMKSDARVLVDFTGERKGFGVLTFSAKAGLDQDAPAFARLDEYATPEDPDMTTVARVLTREYPDHFS